MTDYPYFLGTPTATAVLRATPEDFEVHELLDFEPDGVGDHVLLHIQKRNTNTEWLARQLAKFAQVKNVDVGYCGLKDRNATTAQWFSVNLSGKSEPDWQQLDSGDIRVLRVARNRRKLKRGAHGGNRFVITLHDVVGDAADIERRAIQIARSGVPNYFGEQRFGIDAQNVEHARAMFQANSAATAGRGKGEGDRHRQGIYLSAARSHLFNAVLARRVADGTWNKPLAGDAFILDGTHSFFVADAIDSVIESRIDEHDIHPSGPMWGRGELPTRGIVRELERHVLADEQLLRDGLERAGLDQERRALRLPVVNFEWNWLEAKVLQLSFALPGGTYATTVVRELVRTARA